MSEAIKPTPGPWHVANGVQIRGEREQIAKVWMMRSGEGKANASLIAEAGTVRGETGLTPRQLVERVKDLEAAAKLVLDWYEAENDHSKADFYQRMQMCRDSEDAIRAALSKSLPNTVAEVE